MSRDGGNQSLNFPPAAVAFAMVLLAILMLLIAGFDIWLVQDGFRKGEMAPIISAGGKALAASRSENATMFWIWTAFNMAVVGVAISVAVISLSL